jgi:phosphohistidine phosphatase SixA
MSAAVATTRPWRRAARQALLALALAWTSFVAWGTWSRWPSLPLDTGRDATTLDARQSAELEHIAYALGLGAGGAALFISLAVLIGRRPKPATQALDDAWTGPARILIMRHAEKTGAVDDIHLSKAGLRRAERLATYIPNTFGKPDFIFAAAQSRRSIRSIETMQPLAAAIGKEVRFDVEDKEFAKLVQDLKTNALYRGALVVICWHHGKIPGIASELGAADGTYPSDWPDKTFDLILELDYSRGAPPVVKQIVEPF